MGGRALLCLAVALGCTSLPDRSDPFAPARTSDAGEAILEFRWKHTIHDRAWDHQPQEFASPALVGRVAFVGSASGMLYAFRVKDGHVLWKRQVNPTSTRPVVDRGRIYLGTDDGHLLALDTFDGSERWRYTTRGAIAQPPVLAADMILFSNDNDQVVALDRDTGKLRWEYQREAPEEFTMRGHAGVLVDGERVYTGFADGNLVALTLQGGEAVWVRSLAGAETRFTDVDSTPVLYGDTLFASSTAGGLYALDVSDGTERWRYAVKGAGAVAVDEGHVYFAAADEGLFAVDHKGNLIWRQGLRGAGDPAQPVLHDGVLFLSTSDAGLFVVDKESGRLLQRFDPGPGISSEPAIDGRRLLVLSNGGVVYSMTVR